MRELLANAPTKARLLPQRRQARATTLQQERKENMDRIPRIAAGGVAVVRQKLQRDHDSSNNDNTNNSNSPHTKNNNHNNSSSKTITNQQQQ